MMMVLMIGERAGEQRERQHGRRWIYLTCVLLGLFLLAPLKASAQDIQLQDVIRAKIETPQAFYVLRASRLKYQAMKPKKTFLPELYKTVEKKPF